MHKENLSIRLTLWINRLLAVLVFSLVFFLPGLLRWYSSIRMLTEGEQKAILLAFYGCAVFVELAFYHVDRLLTEILAGKVFIRKNVRRIRCIQWCCAAVSLLCIFAAVFYLPLIFLVVIMAFLSLSVGVIASVLDRAVEIREENDLTN